MSSTRRFNLVPTPLLLAVLVLGLAIRVQAQTESVIYIFTGGDDGQYPTSTPVVDSAGTVYGTTTTGGELSCQGIGCGTVFEISPLAKGWNFDLVHIFSGGNDGAEPQAGVLMDASGSLYATTSIGGNHNVCVVYGPGCGAIVRFRHENGRAWNWKTLATLNEATSGWYPLDSVVMDSAGNLYGTTEYGGSNDYCNGSNDGCGTVFKLTPQGDGYAVSVLYVFHSSGDTTGGYLPFSGVSLDANGNLYGTTWVGGLAGGCFGFGCGVVYKLSPTQSGLWTETVLYTFTGGHDGAYPSAGVTLDSDGNIYGTAQQGGNISDCPKNGCGTVFVLQKQSDGNYNFEVRHTFTGSDGAFPSGNLIFDSHGNLLGTTWLGGDMSCNNGDGCGTVFQLAPPSDGGGETVLHAFTNAPDGYQPSAGVHLDGSGNIFGTTQYGGISTLCCGTVFEIKPSE